MVARLYVDTVTFVAPLREAWMDDAECLDSDPEIFFSMDSEDIKEAKILEIDFLKDSRHNIYPPEKVEVTIGDRKYGALLSFNDEAKVSKVHVSIPIDIQPSDKTIYIKTIKSSAYKNKAIACDEVFFKK